MYEPKTLECTQDEWDAALLDIMSKYTYDMILNAIPGVYEAISEYFNNDVIDYIENKRGRE
jgi:hypothetical protein